MSSTPVTDGGIPDSGEEWPEEPQWVVWLDTDREPAWADALLRACCAYSKGRHRTPQYPVAPAANEAHIRSDGQHDPSEEERS